MTRFYLQLGQAFVFLLSILASVNAQDLSVNDFRKVFSTTSPPTRVRVNENLPLLAILMEFPDQRHNFDRQDIHDMLFAPERSVIDYFDWVSDGRFAFEQAGPGTLGWYMAPREQNDYNNMGENGTNVRRTDTIRAAQEDLDDLDLAGIDRNGDRVLTADELTIVLIWARGERTASVRASDPRRVDIGRGYSIEMPLLAIYENRIGTFPGGLLSPAAAAHEISHVAFGLGDEYETDNPHDTTTESLCGFSLMANDWALNNQTGVPILDAWSLFQLGWSDARLATGETCFQLRAVEHDHSAIIVPIYGKGVAEYFIVENRFPAGTYNGGFAPGAAGVDQGIAVWHIDETIENDGIINHRRAIRLMRATGPVPAITCPAGQQHKSLFDASDPATGYALSDSSSPRNTKTRDGSSTGIGISSISGQGETVTVYIRNPYDSITSRIGAIEAEIEPLKDRLKFFEREKQLLRAQLMAGDITERVFQELTALNATQINSTSARIDVLVRRLARVERDVVTEFASSPVRNGCIDFLPAVLSTILDKP